MSEQKVNFRSKHKRLVLFNGDKPMHFVGHVYSTSDPAEIAILSGFAKKKLHGVMQVNHDEVMIVKTEVTTKEALAKAEADKQKAENENADIKAENERLKAELAKLSGAKTKGNKATDKPSEQAAASGTETEKA